MMMAEFCPNKKAQKQQSNEVNTGSCIKEQEQQQQPTIIRNVLAQEVSIMAQQSLNQTHMTLKKYFEFSNDATNTTSTRTASKRINKNMHVKQRAQNIDQQGSKKAFLTINSGKHDYQLKLRPTFIITTGPSDIPNQAAISSSSSAPFTLLSSPRTKTTTDTVKATAFDATATVKALTIPVTGDVVKNSQSKIKQCNNVCINSKCGSKQKCSQQQKQKQHSKSANISNSENNLNNILTFSKTNINTHITDDNADAASTSKSPTATAAVEGIANTNIITTTSTTNKANIRFNTISTTTITATATHTDNVAVTTEAADVAATIPTEQQSTLAAAITTYCKAFPLRQRFYPNTKKLECLLRTVVFSFMFVMWMQYQTGK